MTKTQVYFRPEDLRALHRIARARKQPSAELIREAVQEKWLSGTPKKRKSDWPVDLWTGPVPPGGGSDNHGAALGEID